MERARGWGAMTATATLYIAGMSAFGVCGWWAGGTLAQRKSETEATAYTQALRQKLSAEMVDLGIGAKLPPVALTSTRSGATTTLAELMASGGTALYVEPSCHECWRAVAAFDSAVTLTGSQSSYNPMVVAGSADSLAGFLEEAHRAGLSVDVYFDHEEILRRVHGIHVFPLILRVTSDGTLAEVRPSGYEVGEYVSILHEILHGDL